ncbi:MAG: killer suppression protein [Anaerolineae bacterium]|nr:killer suppression protein [Anaerolineae bacterium]
MDVYFGSERLANLLQSPNKLSRTYGAENAKLIPKRLDNLRFAANLEEMHHLPGHLHELSGDRAGTLAIVLKHGLRLIIEPAEEPAPRKPDGGLDWRAITAVVVVAVEDYHD